MGGSADTIIDMQTNDQKAQLWEWSWKQCVCISLPSCPQSYESGPDILSQTQQSLDMSYEVILTT